VSEAAASAPGAARTTGDAWDWHWRRVRLPQLPRRINPNAVFTRRLLRRALGPGARSSLEVGCAPGAWMALLGRSFGLDVAGCDLSPRGVAATEENLRRLGVPARVRQACVFRLADEAPERFDLVYSLGVVEHFDDLGAIVRAHARLCAPGGRVVLTAPNLRGLSGALYRRASPTLLESHRVVTPEELRRAARAAGLEPLEAACRGPLSAFALLDRVESRLARLAGYAAALLLGFLTYPARGPALAGSVHLVARRPGP
jgi:2-polyprenyl-6-hydroxyphenyl methylase/3-demethylubiquinone-9 3-methyltransferase